MSRQESLQVRSRLQFTREIALNDSYLSKYFPARKTLWMKQPTSLNDLRTTLKVVLNFLSLHEVLFG